jgi:ribonuclease HI
MKILKFNPRFVPFIITGAKKTTWRVNDDKNLSVDDEIEFVNSQTNEAFGIGKINQIIVKRLADITESDYEGHEAYESKEAMYAEFRQYYGNDVGPDTHVKIIDFTFAPYKKPKEPNPQAQPVKSIKLYADGGSRGNPGPSASGYVLLDMDDNVIKKSGVYLGITTNNQAEYQALKFGLEEAQKLGAREVAVYMDSLLVINQMKGLFKVRNRDLWPIHEAIKDQVRLFKKVTFTHVPRELNKLADAEVNTTLDAEENN